MTAAAGSPCSPTRQMTRIANAASAPSVSQGSTPSIARRIFNGHLSDTIDLLGLIDREALGAGRS